MASFETKITGEMRDLIRFHFGDSSRIDNSLLKSMTYSSNIKIEAGGKEDHAEPSRTPAIYLYPEQISTANMNPMYDYTVTVGGVDAVSNSYVDMEKGVVMILCEADYQGQASNIGYEVFNYIKKTSPILKEDFELFHIAVKNFSAKQPVNQKMRTSYVATVAVPWTRFNAWTLS